MKRAAARTSRRATILLMVVGLLAMLFMIVTAYIALARFDRSTNLQARSGQLVEQTLAAMTDVLTASLTRGAGSSLVTGEGYADIAGYRKGAPISVIEPVLDPAAADPTKPKPADFWMPGVTSLNGDVGPKTLDKLMVRDPNRQTGNPTVVVNPFNPDDMQPNDTKYGARWSLMDAFGTGIPNSYFGGTSKLTELANTVMSGTAVATQNLDLTKFNLNDPLDSANRLRSQYFDQQARHIAAATILPHGGMVLVGSSGATAWNSQFITGMFNWVRHPTDASLLDPGTDAAKLVNVTATRATIEPLLRIRGGLLIDERTGRVVDDQDWSILPPALRALQAGRFDATFTPIYVSAGQTGLKASNYERFNIAAPPKQGTAGPEWTAWWQAVSLSVDKYNKWYVPPHTTEDPRLKYVPRHLLTTVNNSDEAARVQTAATTQGSDLRLTAGDLKFYLGEITNPTTGAFNADGTFNPGTFDPPTRGTRIVRELARYFREMLAGYGAWRDKQLPANYRWESLTQLEQAYMLAVNTVAAAAPRRPLDGAIDAVWYTDASNNKTYYGYAPQPFFTQVIAYNRPDTNNPKIALAIELYNPNEATTPGGSNQDLFWGQFALSLYDDADPAGGPVNPANLYILNTKPAPALTPLKGRSFAAVALHGPGNSYFDGHVGQQIDGVITATGDVPFTPNSQIVVKLWRNGLAGAANHWHLVDRIEVDASAQQPDQEWYVSTYRDTHPEPYFAFDVPAAGQDARWRMLVAYPHDKSGYKKDDGSGSPDGILGQLKSPLPGDGTNGQLSFEPSVPLYTMNANLGSTPLHGGLRPNSYPTVGFLLFVPRFAHLHDPTKPLPTWRPRQRMAITDLLFEHWDQKKYVLAQGQAQSVPADFGHTPVFDNTQPVASDSEFYDNPNNPNDPNNRTGRIPWGLLVFDYFTTLDPKDPANPIDPDHVPGRININDAPWYVLAGLPVIGPDTNGRLPIAQSASPAFWSPTSGVLVGMGGTTPRFPRKADNVLMYADDAANPPPGTLLPKWYRLGPYLAQAVAAYRDRVAYLKPDTAAPALPGAEYRNGNGPPGSVYRPQPPQTGNPGQYGGIRGADYIGADPTKLKRGFLSVGELANVKGFDVHVLGSTDPNVNTDYFRAVSLLALLDTHFLTTRSNTFTVYATLTDRVNPQASVRSQVTIDRGKLLPRIAWDNSVPPKPIQGSTGALQNNGDPELIGERQVAYFNARYDD